MMHPVVIETPYREGRGWTRQNLDRYLDRCLRDSLARGESPYASHAILTRVLNDDDDDERDHGIVAGYAWQSVADRVIFYTDLGWSEGMKLARERCVGLGITFSRRQIGRAGL